MNSESQVRIPVIDFSKEDLKPGTLEWDLVKAQVRQALQEYGCFKALIDKALEVRKAFFGAMEELFDLPLQTKERYVNEKPFRGYYGATEPESVFINESNIAENIEQHLTNILWPEGNTSFSKALLSFSEPAARLEKTIRTMILESFGLEKYVDELMESTNYLLRVVKYEWPQTGEPTLGTPAHIDQNMVTLLYQNEVNGLEIQTKDGEWINVKLSLNTFMVMAGETLRVWLNGRLPSPCHRVIITGNKTRYSAVLFSILRGGYPVKVPEELVDDENPLLFKPFDYEEFEQFYATQFGRGAGRSSLKVYCSV
ncbi:hypothetical protein DITRI_Ditri07aG0040100 [Diplodiscus trichospermus]